MSVRESCEIKLPDALLLQIPLAVARQLSTAGFARWKQLRPRVRMRGNSIAAFDAQDCPPHILDALGLSTLSHKDQS